MGLLDQLRRELAHALGDDVDIHAMLRHAGPDDSRIAPVQPSQKPTAKRTISTDSFWIPPGRRVTIGGYVILGGMLYIGTGLPAVNTYVGTEPALIDPVLPLSRKPSNGWLRYYYAPAYKDLPPPERAAYLRWLAGDRRDPNAPVEHVLLFFYGLERRLMADALRSPKAWEDAPAIVAEVERLLEAYGGHYSFAYHARNFLEAVRLLDGDSRRAYEDPPPDVQRGWELPYQIKLALGQLSADRKSIPAAWALAWLRAHPDTRLPTPATRCPEEFKRLFILRYQEQFGEGMVLKPNKRRLHLQYRAASKSFAGGVKLPVGNVPDISGLRTPVQKLTEIGSECSEALRPYSRWALRHPDDTDSIAAAMLLPPELAGTNHKVEAVRAWIEERLADKQIAMIEGADLIAHWPATTSGKLTKSEFVLYAQLLDRLGYGVEPDARFGGPTLSAGRVAIFRLSPGPTVQISSAYMRATLLLHLANAVCFEDGAPGEAERWFLYAYAEMAPSLTDAERHRLRAHLAWRLTTGARLTGLKSRLAGLPAEDRPTIGRFLVSVAAADGPVSHEEVKALEKIYRLLGLAPGEVYGEIHAHTVSQAAREPVRVRAAAPTHGGFAIPAPPSRQVVLDGARVERKLADSAAVSALLGSIFQEEDPGRGRAAPPPTEDQHVSGLDAAHSALVCALAVRPSWRRMELEALAADQGLLPEGALDTINEASLEASGEPACEGEDPIQMNEEALKELLA